MTRVYEIQDPQGGRNQLRAGDPVRVAAAGAEGRGFKAAFRYAEVDAAGRVVAVTVTGGRGYVPGLPARQQDGVVQWRTVAPGRVRRMSVATAVRKVDLAVA